jgi:hypothetical protein
MPTTDAAEAIRVAAMARPRWLVPGKAAITLAASKAGVPSPGGQAKGITMADSKQGSYDPKKGGKFSPTTKAKPPPPPRPGHNKDK